MSATEMGDGNSTTLVADKRANISAHKLSTSFRQPHFAYTALIVFPQRYSVTREPSLRGELANCVADGFRQG